MDSIDIIGYLSARGARFTRMNRRWVTILCPLHSERTPSFAIDTNDGHAFCYGCQVYLRDVVDLIWKLEFPADAKRTRAFARAREMGVIATEPRILRPAPRDLSPPSDEQIQAMTLATTLWHSYLDHPKVGEPARNWLQQRGLQGPFLDKVWHLIGYAPSGPRASHMLQQRLESALGEQWFNIAVSAGLISPGGNFLYRGRVILASQRLGHTLFFQGRAMSEEVKPKYYNPPAIRKSAFIPLAHEDALYPNTTAICEGPLDALALAVCGVYAIGLAGSNLKTLRQSDIVGTVADYLDNEAADQAGGKASEALQAWCQAKAIRYYHADYPSGIKDPIRWLQRYGDIHLAGNRRMEQQPGKEAA